jgi:hypothetical protein
LKSVSICADHQELLLPEGELALSRHHQARFGKYIFRERKYDIARIDYAV